MITTLVGAANRGVQVKLLIPGAIDHNLVRQASRWSSGACLKNGVQIYEYRPALLHAKTMVVDHRATSVHRWTVARRLNEELNSDLRRRHAQRLERCRRISTIRSAREARVYDPILHAAASRNCGPERRDSPLKCW